MDPVSIGLGIALIGILGVVVGASLTEVFAGRRSSSTEKRFLDREQAARIRDRSLVRLDETHRQMAAVISRHVGIAVGDRHQGNLPFRGHAYPKADVRLVGDVDVLAAFFSLVSDLVAVAPAAGLPDGMGVRVTQTEQRIAAAIDKQEARVERGESLQFVSDAEFEALAGQPRIRAVIERLARIPVPDGAPE